MSVSTSVSGRLQSIPHVRQEIYSVHKSLNKKNIASLALLGRLLLLLNLPPCLHRARHLAPHIRPQVVESLHHAVSVPISHLLAHLKLALHPINLNLHADDGLLHDVEVRRWRIRHLPRLGPGSFSCVAHGDLFVEARQGVNLATEESRCLLCVGINVERCLAVDLDGGIVPCAHHFARHRLGCRVELWRDVVLDCGGEHDQDVLLQRPRVVSCGLALLDLVDDGLALGVGAGHVSPQLAELGLAGFILDV